MRHSSLLIFLVCTLLLPGLIRSASAAENPPSSAQEEVPAKEQTQKSNETQQTTIIQFYTWSAMLPNDLIDLKTKLSSENFDELRDIVLPAIAADTRDLQWDVNNSKSIQTPQKFTVDSFQARLNKIHLLITKIEKSLTESISRLSRWRNNWDQKKEQLRNFSDSNTLSLAMAIEDQQKLNQTIDQGIALTEDHLKSALILGKELANLQVRLHTVRNELESLNATILSTSTQRTAPTILSADFYKQINTSLFFEAYSSSKQFIIDYLISLKDNIRIIFAGCLLFAIFCLAISQSRHLVTASSRWYPFAACPLATGIFIFSVTYRILNRMTDTIFIERWEKILIILSLIAVYRLVKYLVDEKLKQALFSRLAMTMVILTVITTLQLPQFLMLLFVVGASIMSLMIYAYQLRVKYENTWQLVVRRSWGILPAMIILASLTGYDQFAIVAFTTIMASFGTCLIVWMLYHLSSGLLELFLKITPFGLLRDNMSVIVKSLQPFLALAHIILTLGLLSVIWDINPSLDMALQSLTDLGFDLGGFHVSPGVLMTIFTVLYGTILASRAIQALILKEVMPRYKASKGVQISITRLVHYAILIVGFFVMLNFLGFDITQLTLLGGALGVGIGFGLQAIVNNFVSGLILLFERPIKVGDTIQVGTELGEVKNLGLRATTIQTFDNAEIVVPNADLVTGQVINWTLAERKVRIRIPVGVAYGTDVSKVLDILKACADSHPMVLNSPTPLALFLAFGASSLDFELRFWIPEFLDKTIATSELNQSIESEFALNNIEIPFMQTDLHIRSIDPAAAMALSGKQAIEQPAKTTAEVTKELPEEKIGENADVPA